LHSPHICAYQEAIGLFLMNKASTVGAWENSAHLFFSFGSHLPGGNRLVTHAQGKRSRCLGEQAGVSEFLTSGATSSACFKLSASIAVHLE
jgi:hypothetical protein